MGEIKLERPYAPVPIEVLERAESALDCRVKLLCQSIHEATGRRSLGMAEVLREGKSNDIKALEIIRAIIKKYHEI